MKYYLAPLEGITNYIFRQSMHTFFPEGIDKYFAPFIMPYEKHILTAREINQLCPEHNEGIRLIPQIMTENATEAIRIETALRELGYDEYNLNLGCPSGTVVSKGRGAGMLTDADAVKEYLDYIYSNTKCKVSVKTRLGMNTPDEFFELLDVYNCFPMEELIIHPRVGREMYSGQVHMDMYEYALSHSSNRLVYNGDILTPADADRVMEKENLIDNKASSTEAIMIGRGVLRNPSLIREISGGEHFSKEELWDFLEKLRTDYIEEMSGESAVIKKLKELWSYLGIQYKDSYAKEYKTLMKAKTVSEIRIEARKIVLDK